MRRTDAIADYTRSLVVLLVARLAEQERIIRDQAESIGVLRAQLAALEALRRPEVPLVPDPLPSIANGHRATLLRRRSGLVLAGFGLLLAVATASCQGPGSVKHAGLCTVAWQNFDRAVASPNLINWPNMLAVVTTAEKVC